MGKLRVDTNTETSLERLELETHLCGAVLINSKHVLCSAHCVRFSYDQKLGVGFGSGDLLGIHDKGRIPIKRIIYNATNQIDNIAILELEREIDFKVENLVRPACFNRYVERIEEYSSDLTSTGWNLVEKQFAAKDYFTINRYHNQLKFKDISMQDRNCNKLTRICARSKSSMNCDCYTDTGAPLHLFTQPNTTTVVGMHQVSFFRPTSNGTIGCPEIYFTRISSKLDFIQSVVKDRICLV